MTNRKFHRDVRRSIEVLQAMGYTAAPASIGGFDIVGLSSTDCTLVKVCQGKPPWAGAIAELQAVTAPPNTKKLVHRWPRRSRLPQTIEL
jgi:hypothetical protein